MKRRRRKAAPPDKATVSRDRPESELRIIGGDFRGKRLRYSGRFDTRPMKERVREAIFNLVGPSIRGMHAIDLFAGTGALGLEAISRGAASATFVERHVPTARIVRQNIEHLGVADRADIVSADTLVWVRQQPQLPDRPWAIFCSPPYELYQQRLDELLQLVDYWFQQGPADSLIVVEADQRFDFSQLPHAEHWRVRNYLPAVVGIACLPAGDAPPDDQSD